MNPQSNDVSMQKLLEEAGAIKKGHFLLSSGLRSDRYCQCAALFENPVYGTKVAQLMAELVLQNNHKPDVVLAPALGAVLWGYELAKALGVRFIFAERPDGKTFELRRGFQLEKGQHVILAEDVITTGGSVLEMVPIVAEADAVVEAFCCVADRSKGAFAPEQPFYSLLKLEFQTWTADNDPLAMQGSRPVKPGSRGKS